MAGSEYQKRQEGNDYVFAVKPARTPRMIGLAVIGVIFVLIGSQSSLGWFILVPLGALAIWAGLIRDGRPKAHRTHSSFRVSPTAIEANGKLFPREEIHRLIIKNVFYNFNTWGSISHQKKVSELSNALELETGGKAYVLAGGMDETTAYGLLTEVSRVAGLAERSF